MPLQLRPHERIVFLGDSITEQNLWTLYVETELLIRFPEHRLRFRNRGWASNRAPDGLARFDRDVTPLKPTWVWLAFGMNDGGYRPLSQRLLAEYTTALTALVEKVRAIGARPLILGPTAVGERFPGYNETLAHFRDGAHGVAEAAGAPFIDLLPPLIGRDDLLLDGVHPNEAGHRVIADSILTALDLPPRPVWRGSLPAGASETWGLFREGERIASVTTAEAAAGVPLLHADLLLALGQSRWQFDRAEWRVYGPIGPEGERQPSLAQIEHSLATAAERERWALIERMLETPLTLQAEEVLDLTHWEISGPYLAGDEDPATFPVKPTNWRTAKAPGGRLDFLRYYGAVQRASAFARTWIQVKQPGELRLALGSDDGFQAWLDGQPIGANLSLRSALRGEDRMAVHVEPGLHELRLRVHQGLGAWEFLIDGWLTSGEPVTLVAPRHSRRVVQGGYVASAARGTAAHPAPASTLSPLPEGLVRRGLEPADEGALVALWNRSFPESYPMRAKLLRQVTWQSPQFDLEGSQTVWDGERLVAAIFLKRFLVPMHAVPDDGRGFIQALFVDPEYQGRGIGTVLLQDGIAHIRRYWQGVIRIGGDPDRLFPGIPSESPALTWFARRGAVLGKPGIDLQNLELQETEYPYGDEYRPAAWEDREDLLAFLAMEFPGRWTWEVAQHFETGGRPEEIMLAEREGRIVGFAMIYTHESARVGPGVYWTCGREGEPLAEGRVPGGLGPIGVGLSVRGKGMGLGLLQAGLAELQRRGVTEAVIDWTSLVQFYGKAGFRPWRYYTMAQFE